MPFPEERSHLAREFAWLTLAAAAWLLAVFFLWLHAANGLPVQRVNIRWAPGVSAADRMAVEQRAGLTAGREGEQRTWSYLLQDRSRDNIRSLVSNPLVEDTAHIDRVLFRVRLDWPGRSAWLRALAETDRLPLIAVALTAIGIAATGRSRQVARRVMAPPLASPRSMWRVMRHARRNLQHGLSGGDRAGLTRGELAAGIGLGLLFLLPLLTYGPYEEEIVQATVFPNQMFYRALFQGSWLVWLNGIGFGTPFPFGDPFMFHPVFGPLAGAGASLRITLSALWVAHTIVMVVYFLRLCVVSGIRRPLRLVLLACYVASAPSITYFYDTDWVQMVITWTLYPVLVFYLRSAVRGDAGDRFWFTALRLALLFGFCIINGHPGYIGPLVLVLAIYTLCAARPTGAVYGCLGVGAALCALIAAARIYFLFHEMRLFAPGASFLRASSSLGEYLAALTLDPGDRPPFIGLGLAAAVLASVIRLPALRDAHLRACTVAVVAAVTLNVLPPWMPGFSGWMFRDAVIFFGLLAGGHMLQRGLGSGGVWAGVAILLLAVQVVHQSVALVAPGVGELVYRRGPLLFYKHQGHPVGLGGVLVEQARRLGPRVYFSPGVNEVMRGRLSADGIHFSTDLVFLGLNPVNGWFKNVSMDPLAPASLIMEGAIPGTLNGMQNGTMLDVLGINLVVATTDEAPFSPDLPMVERYAVTSNTGGELQILANPDAWPLAVLMDADAQTLTLPIHEGCEHDRALCRDYEALHRSRLPGTVALTTENGRYVARVPPADRDRLLFLSAYYRPEWEAASPTGPLPIHPVAGAFLGVTVPPGVTDVTVRYVPRTLVLLTWVSSLTFAGLIVVFCVLWRRQRRQEDTVLLAKRSRRGRSRRFEAELR
jgi:hypothetical protein